MSLFSLIAVIVVVGLVLYLVNAYIPMQAQVKTILNLTVIIILILWLLSVLLGFDLRGLGNIRVGR